jgi:hypothetical protein
MVGKEECKLGCKCMAEEIQEELQTLVGTMGGVCAVKELIFVLQLAIPAVVVKYLMLLGHLILDQQQIIH